MEYRTIASKTCKPYIFNWANYFDIISETDLCLDVLMSFPLAYQESMIKVIVPGLPITPAISPIEVFNNLEKTIKFELLEKLNSKLFITTKRLSTIFSHNGPVTAHLFMAAQNAQSFPLHTDPDDVVAYVIAGTKYFEIDSELIKLNVGDALYIPADYPHQAVNNEKSLMLSFGLEKFLMDKIMEIK